MEINVKGILAGFFAALISAILWSIVTILTGYQLGFLALAVGAAVGFAVSKVSGSVSTGTRITAAVLAGFGILYGVYLTTMAQIFRYVAEKSGVKFAGALDPLLLALFKFDPMFLDIASKTFGLWDALFILIGIYFGYKYAGPSPEEGVEVAEEPRTPSSKK